MNRRGFLGNIAKGAVTLAAVPLVLTPAQIDATPPAKVADIQPGTRHFAILLNIHGQAIRTLMVDNLPQEIVIQHRPTNPKLATKGTTFRLVSQDRYDGRTIEGLARYIYFDGPEPTWPIIKLGF